MNPSSNPFDVILTQLNDHRRSDPAVQALILLCPHLRLEAQKGPARQSALDVIRAMKHTPLRDHMLKIVHSLAGLDYIYDGSDKAIVAVAITLIDVDTSAVFQVIRTYDDQPATFEIVNERPDLMNAPSSVTFAKDESFKNINISSASSLPSGVFRFQLSFQHPDYEPLYVPMSVFGV